MAQKPDFATTIAATQSHSDRPDSQQVLLIAMQGNHTGQIFNLERSTPLTVIGREDISDIQILDAEISRRHAAIRYDAAAGKFSIADLKSRNGTRINGVAPDGEVILQVGDKIQFGNTTILRVSLASEAEAKYAQKMYQAVLRDGLTGAFNRRYLDERLSSELAFAKRHDAPLTFLLADLDHFKKVNDDYGHRAGDHVLKRFVELMQAEVRAEDVVARYGGEEFSVLCRDTDEEQAAVLAERLRSSVQNESFHFEGTDIPVTVSIGIAGTLEQKTYKQHVLVELADKALYQAKDSGRNCWRVANS